MSEANETVAELRAKLAEAEKAEKAEKAAKRQAEKEKRRQEDIANADAFREENYEATAGDYGRYVGVMDTYSGVQIDIVDWSSVQSSASLTREQAEKLRDALTEILR